ncbi:hypothetical protein BV22DRAFT_786541 [Leucogyrophana mollusca]|uniref:Uncharacterized protein n=1 Tax=Leucogyrophana mollusca TaxID=85980 RepID=A0ACB8B6Z9_9AGAM|nr:hypothetical protein BV22DRAFT_786541 [Leucogyrophana mollusca]
METESEMAQSNGPPAPMDTRLPNTPISNALVSADRETSSASQKRGTDATKAAICECKSPPDRVRDASHRTTTKFESSGGYNATLKIGRANRHWHKPSLASRTQASLTGKPPFPPFRVKLTALVKSFVTSIDEMGALGGVSQLRFEGDNDSDVLQTPDYLPRSVAHVDGSYRYAALGDFRLQSLFFAAQGLQHEYINSCRDIGSNLLRHQEVL